MDQTVADKLYEIRQKHMSALTEADKAFLRARQSYLGKRDQAKYADIINAKPAKVKAPKVDRKEMARLKHPAAL